VNGGFTVVLQSVTSQNETDRAMDRIQEEIRQLGLNSTERLMASGAFNSRAVHPGLIDVRFLNPREVVDYDVPEATNVMAPSLPETTSLRGVENEDDAAPAWAWVVIAFSLVVVAVGIFVIRLYRRRRDVDQSPWYRHAARGGGGLESDILDKATATEVKRSSMPRHSGGKSRGRYGDSDSRAARAATFLRSHVDPTSWNQVVRTANCVDPSPRAAPFQRSNVDPTSWNQVVRTADCVDPSVLAALSPPVGASWNGLWDASSPDENLTEPQHLFQPINARYLVLDGDDDSSAHRPFFFANDDSSSSSNQML
jgi:hypothetical protein